MMGSLVLFFFLVAFVSADLLHGGEVVQKMYWTNDSYFDGNRCAFVNVRPRISFPAQPWGTYCFLRYSSSGHLYVIAHHPWFTSEFPKTLAHSSTCSRYPDLEGIRLDEILGMLTCGQNREAIMWH